MSLKWGAVHPTSSLQATLEVGLVWVGYDMGTDSDIVIGWLDAALEYWLMKHQSDKLGNWSDHRGTHIASSAWDDTLGWQCSCLEDDNA